jgi:sortase A
MSISGRVLITIGILTLLFVAYELWGTGIWTARAQARLKHEFARDDARLHASTTTVRDAPARRSTPTTIDPRLFAAPAEGVPIGDITIPSIGIHGWEVTQGDSQADLANGPGHDMTTPMPGQLGNVFIPGHRTTHGAPFGNIDQIKVGDDIFLHTHAGTFRYRMFEQLIVKKTDVWVAAPTADAQLTLASCHPKGSSSHRMVVKAMLVVEHNGAKPRRATTPLTSAGRSRSLLPDESDRTSLDPPGPPLSPAVLWGALAALAGALWWWAFRRWRLPLTWMAGAVPFLAVLFVFYTYLERVLPNGY